MTDREHEINQSKRLTYHDKPWSEYPIGTKAHAFNGGFWIKVKTGWKWCTGSIFPTPGGDACGYCIDLPKKHRTAPHPSSYPYNGE